jgi:hypothetical protein
MNPWTDARLLFHWMPGAADPPPLLVVAAVGLLSVVLVAGLVVVDLWLAKLIGTPGPAARPQPAEVAPPEPAPAPSPALPDLAALDLPRLALSRLARFVELADDPAVRLDLARHQLAQRAVFSAYRDCVALGLGDDARAIMRSALPAA